MSIAKQFQEALDAAGQTLERQMAHPGVTLAVVTNVNDEQKLNRVKCLPVQMEQGKEAVETDWCYVMAPLAGKEYGQFFRPNVNDMVVLAYFNGDPCRPVVLGSLWNTKAPPPYTIEGGKNLNYSIKVPGGTELLFYDEKDKSKVTLTLPSGTVLTVDDEKKTATLQDKGGDNQIAMDWNKGEVAVKAKTKLTLAAGDTQIVLESSGNMTQKAGNKVTVQGATIEGKGSAKVSFQGGQAEVKANGTLNLEASGITTVKGSLVNIN